MHNYLIAIIIILIIILIYQYTTAYFNNRDLVPFIVDNDYNIYKVSGNYDNSDQAGKILDEVNNRLLAFFKYLKTKYQINKEYDFNPDLNIYPSQCREIVQLILFNYNPESIIENDPKKSTDTSYTILKGKELHVCLRNRDDPSKLQNIDDIMFVILHEITHMGNKTWDLDAHGTKFWTYFKFILHEAKLAGIYEPVNYRLFGVDYCGLFISYSPYFDDNLENIWETK